VSDNVKIPVIAAGGCGNLQDFYKAIEAGASAAAAGSIFVYHGPRRGVLINYPTRKEIQEIFSRK
jgi:cyclase